MAGQISRCLLNTIYITTLYMLLSHQEKQIYLEEPSKNLVRGSNPAAAPSFGLKTPHIIAGQYLFYAGSAHVDSEAG